MHMQVFRNATVGMLVRRSAHQRAHSFLPDKVGDILGIVVDKAFFEEAGRVLCYPVVH